MPADDVVLLEGSYVDLYELAEFEGVAYLEIVDGEYRIQNLEAEAK